jgi:acetolactate synthase regulatory subunit
MLATVCAMRSAYLEERRNIAVFVYSERATQKLSAQMKALIDLRTAF